MSAPADARVVQEESARAYREAFARALRPDPRITVSEWADQNRLLSSMSSGESGRWRTDRTPYLREIMDCLSSTSPVEDLWFCKGAQLGGTEAGNNWIGYVVDHCPGPMMLVMPKDAAGVRKSRQTLDTLFEVTPSLREKVTQKKSRDSGNTTRLKTFPGGMLALASAHSAADLRSMPVRFLFLDEVDGYPEELEGEGDPVELAERGTKNFAGRRKVFRVSTPTIEGRSRIMRGFLGTDRRYFHVPCPRCGALQRILWKQIRWPSTDDDLPANVASDVLEGKREVWLECQECRGKIEEWEKERMLPAGVWVPEDPSRGERVRGYHLSALYSPWGMYSWSRSVAKFLLAEGRRSALRVWVNQDLGETWREKGEAPDWRRLHERRERFKVGVVPRGAAIITAGVDVQHDRVEVEVVGWGADHESWSVEYLVFPGDAMGPEVRAELDRLLTREWPREEVPGQEEQEPPCRLAALAIDSGYETHQVYSWVRRYGHTARVNATKGRVGTAVFVGLPSFVDVHLGGRKIQRGVRVWPVDVGVGKEELYGWLEQRPPVDSGTPFPPGYCHFPGYGPDYFKGLCSEILERRTLKSGRSVTEWTKIHERNEPLDCRILARAAAYLLGTERWSRQAWAAARAVAIGAPAPTPPAPPTTAGRDEHRGRGGRWGRAGRKPT